MDNVDNIDNATNTANIADRHSIDNIHNIHMQIYTYIYIRANTESMDNNYIYIIYTRYTQVYT